jgi:hypothetical protein
VSTPLRIEAESVVAGERRHSERVLFCNEVEVVGYGPRRSSDLSPGGMFIETIAAFPRGTVLELRFKVQEDERDPICVKARVLYSADSIGVGVEFLDLLPEDRRRIERVLST